MLHALLHHKLDELIPEPQRREDALTSAVFGTLLLVNAWDLLVRWLGVSYDPSPIAANSVDNNGWFWPRLALAEPDVVLRMGSWLVVVEAKYRSGRNDLVPAEQEGVDVSDQLVRQYESITRPVDERVRYEERLERAITECKLVQLLVIDGSRRRARREWEESKERLPKSDLRLISWQSLFTLLSDLPFRQNRWANDLLSYLRLCGLDAFDGMGRYLADPEDIKQIRQWREQDDYGRWQGAVAELLTAGTIGLLNQWRSSTKESANDLRIKGINPDIIGDARDVIVAWRFGDGHRFP